MENINPVDDFTLMPQIGEPLTKSLNVNSASTVQSLAVLRLGLFTPVNRTKILTEKNNARMIDVSDEFRSLELAKQEGFREISIVGLKLNFDTDFKVWCGIVRAFNLYGYNSENITFNFTEFAKLCGFSSKQSDQRLRERIEDSFIRIRSQTLKFHKPSTGKSYIGGLVSNAMLDQANDAISITADAKLWDLYNIDHTVLLKLKAFTQLKRMEAAKCLYVYLCALPQNPVPISFTRLRERMQLTSKAIKEQNRTIVNAINKLIEIGFLQGHIVKNENDRYLLVEHRCQKLELMQPRLNNI